MNKINPLYFLVILVFASFVMFVKINQSHQEFNLVQEELLKTSDIVSQIKSFKKAYSEKKRMQKKISRLLRDASLKDANIIQKSTRTSLKLSTNSMSKKALDMFMGKVINDTYPIYTMDIKKIDATHVSFKMEFKWQN